MLSDAHVWLVYKNERDVVEIATVPLRDDATEYTILSEEIAKGRRQQVQNDEEDATEIDDDEQLLEVLERYGNHLDMKECYLKLIFQPFRFAKSSIFKALAVQRNNYNYK